MEGKIKVLWLSDLVVPTGFSRVSHSIIEYLPREEYDILGLGVNYYGDPHEYNFPIFPAGVSRDVYGISRLADVTRHNPQIIFILNDAWIVAEYLKAIKEIYKDKDRPKIVVYTPVDAKEHDSDWYKDFDIVDQLVLYTEFARMVVNKAAPQLDTIVIPHGVDTTKFYKMNVDKTTLKKEYFKGKVNNPEDMFIFLNANRNQPRKRLDITMDAFKLFSEGKPDSVKLYLHAGIKDSHIDLIKYSKRLGIDSRLLVTNLVMGTQAVNIEKLNLIYNLCDVGLNSCYLPETKVLTETGYKNIEHVEKGDIVFSHIGAKRKVVDKFVYEKDEEVLEIVPYGMLPFTLTKNHELFSELSPYMKLDRNYKIELQNNLNPKFYRSDLLMEGSLLTFPIIKDELFSIGKEKAFLFGAYASEGSINKGAITFSLDLRQYDDSLRQCIIDYMKAIYNLEPHFYNMERNRQNITFYSTEVAKEFEEMVGKGSYTKTLSKELLFMKREEKLQFLRASILGDGSFDHHTITYTTVSENLAWQIWFMFTTLGNTAPFISRRARGEYVVRLYGENSENFATDADLKNTSKKFGDYKKVSRHKIFIKDGYIYYAIRKINKVNYTGKVYDLEVEGEHSYLTHVAGHNSIGEGWGLINIEHAITGAPQIVPNHSSLTDLYADCGILVESSYKYVQSQIMTVGEVISPEDMADAMEVIYTDKKLYKTLSKAGVDKFSSDEYSWKTISSRFDKVFKEVLNK